MPRMLEQGETFGASYPAVPESVATARKDLTEFARRAGGSDEQLQAVRLAASEAITNAVLHAYDEGIHGDVTVSASYVKDELWVLIGDAGHGMRARNNSPGLGLGLALIAQMTEEFQILSRGSGGTELRMRFALASERGTTDRRPGCSADRRQRLIRR